MLTALAWTLAATFLAYCLFLLKVTREDGERIRLQRAVIDSQRAVIRDQRKELTSHRRTFRDIEHAIELAAQTIRDYEADPLGWQPWDHAKNEAVVEAFRADLERWGGAL